MDSDQELIEPPARIPPQYTWRKARFYAQLAISIMVVIFCMVMVAIEDVGCERTVFMSTITGIVGFWLPSPRAQ